MHLKVLKDLESWNQPLAKKCDVIQTKKIKSIIQTLSSVFF